MDNQILPDNVISFEDRKKEIQEKNPKTFSRELKQAFDEITEREITEYENLEINYIRTTTCSTNDCVGCGMGTNFLCP